MLIYKRAVVGVCSPPGEPVEDTMFLMRTQPLRLSKQQSPEAAT